MGAGSGDLPVLRVDARSRLDHLVQGSVGGGRRGVERGAAAMALTVASAGEQGRNAAPHGMGRHLCRVRPLERYGGSDADMARPDTASVAVALLVASTRPGSLKWTYDREMWYICCTANIGIKAKI